MPSTRKRPASDFPTFKVHGNFCGPGWSDGKYQLSVANPKLAPLDEMDAICREHDMAYARGYDKKKADAKFYRKMSKLPGVKAKLMAAGVGSQGWWRTFEEPKDVAPFTPQKKKRIDPPTPVKTPVKQSLIEDSAVDTNPGIDGSAVDMVRTKSKRPTKLSKNKKTRRRSSRKSNGKRRPRVSRLSKKLKTMITRGVSLTNESGAVIDTIRDDGSNNSILWLGHHDTPANSVFIAGWMSLIKALMHKAGFHFNTLDEAIIAPDNDLIAISYRPTDGGAMIQYSASIVTMVPSAADRSIYKIALYLANGARPYYVSGAATDYQKIFDSIWYVPARAGSTYVDGTVAKINLNKARVQFKVKNVLKFQNRTVNEPSDDEFTTKVDNVPLYVKGYTCKGNKFYAPDRTAVGETTLYLTGSQTTGIMHDVDNNEALTYGEPPHPKVLGAKGLPSKKLQPGQIHTSFITDEFSVLFSDMINKIGYPTFTGGIIKNMLGTSKLYCFDKMIETLGAVDRAPIKVGYESQQDIMALFKPGYSKLTTNSFTYDEAVDQPPAV